MPRLWTDTIETHRHEVRDAILDTTASLVAEHGLLGVTMSRIAEEAGIGRATLYKYFRDVEAVLLAWHQRQVASHLDRLITVRDSNRPPRRLRAVIEAYAMAIHEAQAHHGIAISAAIHHDDHVAAAEHRVAAIFRDLLGDSARRGEIRADVRPAELAAYCVHALAAARTLPSREAVRRLVSVTLGGLDHR